MTNNTISISSSEYRAAWKKAPTGKGNWAFEMSAPGHGCRTDIFFSGYGYYSEAKKSAAKHAAANGWTAIKVLP